MREITGHGESLANSLIRIEGEQRDDNGGCHFYAIYGPDNSDETGVGHLPLDMVRFQNGPIQEAGINGTTDEALLAIVVDRLEGFQTGPYKCRENALAITKIEEALHWLFHRTNSRKRRGVEGTHQI